jgi:hypothetical protein
MGKGYNVEYQVFEVMYFDSSRLLSGTDFAEIWKSTNIFGTQQVFGNFYRLDKIPKANKPAKIQLGSASELEELLSSSNMPIFGGVGCTQNTGRLWDCDFSFVHGSAGRLFGYPTLPHLSMGCSGQWFETAGSDAVVRLLHEHLVIADKHSLPYALIDIAASEDCNSGYVYEAFSSSNNRLHRWAEQMKFAYACSKRLDQARGIYWGNYFGPAILQRLGGRERFLTRFRRQAQYQDGRPSARIWEFTNGVFVSLCIDPLGCKPNQPLDSWAAQNLHWLIIELGSHGVLNPWADELPQT